MTSFLLLLSFLIHLILMISIYQLYEKTKRDKDEQIEQLEKMLTGFMEDIRRENEKLEQKIYEKEVKKHMLSNVDLPIRQQKRKHEVEWNIPDEQINHNKKDIIETSFEGQVLQLAEEGKTVEQIARQLNRGKTEIDLLLKMKKVANK